MLVINKIEAHYIVNQSVTLRKVMLEAKHYGRNVYIYLTSLLRKSQGLNLNAGSDTLCSHTKMRKPETRKFKKRMAELETGR